MAEIEKVIEQLKQLEHCITKSCDETCTYYEDDMYHCHYDVSVEETVDEAIQNIRELQNQIPKWHLVADGDLPKDDTAVIAYIKREITDVFMMVNISSISGKWQMWESSRDLYDDEEVIAWMELPKFEMEDK